MRRKPKQKIKKIFEENLPLQVVSSNPKEDEILEKEYRTYGRKSEESHKSHKSHSSFKAAAPLSNESMIFHTHFEVANHSDCSSKASTVDSNFEDEGASAYKTRPKFKEKCEGVAIKDDKSEELYFAFDAESQKSGNSHKFEKGQRSHDFLDPANENLGLKKTDEITDFKVGVLGGIDLDQSVDNGGPKSSGRRMTSGNHQNQNNFNTGAFKRTKPLKKDLKVRVINEKEGGEASEESITKGDKKTKSCVPLRTIEGNLKRPNKSAKVNNQMGADRDSMRGKYELERKQIVSFFLEDNENFFGKEFIQMNVEEDKSKLIKEKMGEIDETRKEDLSVKATLHHIWFYCLYLIIITIIALSMVHSNMYYFSQKTIELFFDTPYTGPSENQSYINNVTRANIENYSEKTLRNSNTFGDFWAFADSTLVDMFFWDFYYGYMDPLIHTIDDDKKMFFENQILGVARIRQVRVRNDSCLIHPDVQRFFSSCYDYYSIFSEETRPIREDMANSITSTAWVYTSASTLRSSYYWGEISIYGGGGYYLDLSTDRSVTRNLLRELRDNLWISRGTRAVFIDFNLYNANVNLFCICKIVLEFPPTGGMIPSPDFHSLKLIRYLNTLDFFILALEFLLLIFIIYFTIRTISRMAKLKGRFFFSWWNYIDVIILLLCYIFVALAIARFIYVHLLIESVYSKRFEYIEFTTAKDLQIHFNSTIAVLLFFSWIKLFQFLKFSITLVEFKRTLARSLKDILGFFPMFLTMFMAFAFLAYLLFGNQVKDYNTVWLSFLTLLQAFLGEFEYQQIQETNKILGPIFYIAFIFFIFFVLLNVFIAIINDAYTAVKMQVISDTPKTGEYLKRGFLNFIHFCCCGLDKKLEKPIKLKKKIVYDEVVKTLKNAGFREAEIKLFFSKYDINVDNILDPKTRNKIMEDLELNRIDFSENANQFQITALRRKIDSLNDKIKELERNMVPIQDKVDVLLRRL